MKFKKFIAITLCLIMCTLLCPMVSAAPATKISLSQEAAFPGEEATVDVMITGNPGIMSMTFSVTYDEECFEFVSFSKGFVTNPTYKNHSDKGYVAFSISETSDKTNSGNILSVTFKVKDNTTPDTYPITIANVNPAKYGSDLNNCFVNQNEDSIMPTVSAGSIRIKGECDISGHKFSDWTETKPANCTETGLEERVCSVCEEVEEKKTPLKHDFEAEWTIDKAATPTEDGIMSRHCKLCTAVTDELKFSYEEIGGNDDDTTSSNTSSGTNSSTESDVSGTTSSTTSSTPNDTTSDSTTSTSTTSNDTTTSTNQPSQNKPTQKPSINNQPGEKVPQSEVEKLEDYETIKPPADDEVLNNDKLVIEDNDSDEKDSSNKQVSVKGEQDEEKSFFSTPIGIITVIICVLISLGIIALGILLILKKRKSESE